MFDDAKPWIQRDWKLVAAMLIPAIAVIALLLYMAGWILVMSFTDLALFGRKATEWSFVGFDNYERLFKRRGFLNSLWVTTVFTVFSAIIGQNILGFAMAAALRNTGRFTKSFVEGAVILGWILPDVVAAYVWSATFTENGLVDLAILQPFGIETRNFINDHPLFVVIVANVWKGAAWSYILYSAALDTVPSEVVEAARVDGATPLQRAWHITLPILRPHIATNCLFITISSFVYFPLIYALTGGGPGRKTQVLSIFVYQESFAVGKLGYGSAISVAMVLIVAFLSIFYVRLLKDPR
ncbi:MAG: sugar ABC transporter permease [Marinovum algicola]|jgi:multiple sugar transport system permease protein|uniref:Multiple sugar transport system permease protein n=1 Tax=Marinovum algicola TaxID=42444 RepID=A0A975WCK6_9RHOB|nr:sugar ABC transporter permease [Marinovum algicola]AKO99716.1 ABC-type sugar transport system, permease component [Marinovum algicola DG 898]SEJ92381.1 multiple sugar transport system permease protein [Marinovum algicola]SLN65315.1 sn-glycerol-3-phosphate transport system permease protein UgpA [Marinovum algicola]